MLSLNQGEMGFLLCWWINTDANHSLTPFLNLLLFFKMGCCAGQIPTSHINTRRRMLSSSASSPENNTTKKREKRSIKRDLHKTAGCLEWGQAVCEQKDRMSNGMERNTKSWEHYGLDALMNTQILSLSPGRLELLFWLFMADIWLPWTILFGQECGRKKSLWSHLTKSCMYAHAHTYTRSKNRIALLVSPRLSSSAVGLGLLLIWWLSQAYWMWDGDGVPIICKHIHTT